MASDDFNAGKLYKDLTELASIRRRKASPETARDYSILIRAIPILGPEELVAYQDFNDERYYRDVSALNQKNDELEAKLVKAADLSAIEKKAIQQRVVVYYRHTQNEILDAVKPLCSGSAYEKIEKAVGDVITRLTAEYICDAK